MIRNGVPARVGDTFTDSDTGSTWVLEGGAAPHKSSSTGKVLLRELYRKGQFEFFAFVFDDAKWVPEQDYAK